MSENDKNYREEKILKTWKEGDVFNKSVYEKKNIGKDYIFFDGPPFANGLPHYGHLLTGFVKDVFARYHTSLGQRCERKFGWDCHGLPAEMESEKELGVSGRLAIKEFDGKYNGVAIRDEDGKSLTGIAAFNKHCETSVMKYTNEWEDYVTKQGRWVDFKDSYKTMDLPYMESVISAFGKLFDKGLIYESTRVMPYSYKCETPLSNFETKMDNSYREKESKTATVKFKLLEDGVKKLQDIGGVKADKIFLLAWTTTPWTLPSNLALAVGSEIEYGIFEKDDEALIVASVLAEKYKKELEGFKKTHTIKGSQLAGFEYEPLFPYFKDTHGAFKILIGDFVGAEDGTGIVHMAPGFGEDDFKLCKQNGIAVVCPIDDGGKFNDSRIADLKYELGGKDYVLSLFGRCVLEAGENDKGKKNYDGVNEDIIKYLKSQGSWVKTEQYLHNYPHCWRTDTPLIYKSVSSWYVNVAGDGIGEVKIKTGSGEKTIKDRMIELNKGINWIPEHIRDGQFGKWLEGSRDWSISRNRFFGCPIPVWKGSGCEIAIYNEKFARDVFEAEGIDINILGDESKTDGRVKVLWDLIIRNSKSGIKKSFDHLKTNHNELEIAFLEHLFNGHYLEFFGEGGGLYNAEKYWKSFNTPRWRNSVTGKCKKIYVFSSIPQMEEFFRDDYISTFRQAKNSGKYIQKDGSFKITDLHRPYIDELVKIEDGFTISRIEDVFDCWFESGAMPFASVGFKFDEKLEKPHNFPADFIVEYVAQTRGWFYTLMILGTALFDEAPFKNCICHGVILDADGEKLSKRLRNYPDPMVMFDKYGSDAMRWFLLSSQVMRGGELYMDKTGDQIRDASRMVVVPFLSALNFFKTYSQIDDIKCRDIISERIESEMNRYIISVTIDAISKIKVAMDEYNTPLACEAFEKFLDSLNNWYIRRNKNIFWQSGVTKEKQEAFDTLYSVLLNISKAVAPLLPFTTEEIYLQLSNQE